VWNYPTNAEMADKAKSVKELQEIFPNWDEIALLEVLESTDGNARKATEVILEWTAEDAQTVTRDPFDNVRIQLSYI